MQDFEDMKQAVLRGEVLDSTAAETAFAHLLSGTIDTIDIAAFLTALKVRGETPAEILGAVRVLRRGVDADLAPHGAMDTCGTGGDGLNTLNVSTTVALVLAAGGVPIAKHGNRSVSSKSGSSDVLAALGVAVKQPKQAIAEALRTLNIGFLFAPSFHAAMATVGPVRAQLKTRTIFNLLGPLANPAGVKRQLVGTYDARWCQPMAEVLRDLHAEKAWVVHGTDGLDEISISGPTIVTELSTGALDTFEITPEDAGLKAHPLSAIAGGDAQHNAAAMRAVLSGEQGAYFDAVALNAAAGFLIAGKAASLAEGAALAAEILSSGAALHLLGSWAAFTKQHAA
ncbi:MAG: anthranilate phosphoribosyltransferase [Pseudomonadota bacterium]